MGKSIRTELLYQKNSSLHAHGQNNWARSSPQPVNCPSAKPLNNPFRVLTTPCYWPVDLRSFPSIVLGTSTAHNFTRDHGFTHDGGFFFTAGPRHEVNRYFLKNEYRDLSFFSCCFKFSNKFLNQDNHYEKGLFHDNQNHQHQVYLGAQSCSCTLLHSWEELLQCM